MKDDLNCKCIETIEYPVVFKNGVMHIRVECIDCKRFIKWKEQHPSKYKLWFGKYKGKMLKEIPISYLNWYNENGDNKKLKNKINMFLSPPED
tara:strand:+ start:396 stop:674 length:279 start_codon:yes stop_codon:yes gene_type:complete